MRQARCSVWTCVCLRLRIRDRHDWTFQPPADYVGQAMPLTRDQELWGVALWVEKTHADAGWLFIAQQQDRLLAEGDLDGMTMWREVSRRYDELKAMTATQ